MPLDPEVQEALEDLRRELRDRGRAAPADRGGHDRDVLHAREDLDEVLRREGYRLSRRELDELVQARDNARLDERLNRLLDERLAAAATDEDDEGDDEGDDDGDGKSKRKPKAKAKPGDKTPPAGTKDEGEEWV